MTCEALTYKQAQFSLFINLIQAWRLFKEDKSIEVMSASLRDTCVIFEVERVIHVGLLCVQHHVEDRPTMLSVVLMLVGEGALPQPKQPGYFSQDSCEAKTVTSIEELDESVITILYAR